jgi:hypothetical protein
VNSMHTISDYGAYLFIRYPIPISCGIITSIPFYTLFTELWTLYSYNVLVLVLGTLSITAHIICYIRWGK